MPLYDYSCAKCGGFRAWRRMSEADDPEACPSCSEPAARSVVAPSLALMASNNRTAHQRNEKSAHEPKVVSGGQHGHGPGHHPHHHGHSHGHGGAGRPWMIGH